MARRRKKEEVDEGARQRRKRLSSRERRERRKKDKEETSSQGPLDLSWILRDASIAKARKIIDREKARPYWLSIPHAQGDGNPPASDLYPCTTFRTARRTYYGFLFRDHREIAYSRLPDPRLEFTDTIRAIAPHLVD